MTDADLFLATDWSFVEYVRYLHGRRSISLLDLAAHLREKQFVLEELGKHVVETQHRGGKVYILDFASYKPEHIGWLRAQTGLGPEDLNHFVKTPSFSCGETKFRVLATLQ